MNEQFGPLAHRETLAMVALAIVIAGCSSGAPSPPSQPPSHSPSPSASASPSSNRQHAGEITSIISNDAFVDGADAVEQGDLLAPGSVSTSPGGSVRLRLDVKLQNCTVTDDARVDLPPQPGPLLTYVKGATYCMTTTGGQAKLIGGTYVEITVGDPVFGVTVEPEQVTVRVVSGLVELKNLAIGGDAIVIGPMLKSTITPGAAPSEPEIWGLGELPALDQQEIGQMEKQVEPDFSRPDKTDSPVLQRILDGNRFGFGVEDAIARDKLSDSFVSDFMFRQGNAWDVSRDKQILSVDVGFREVLDGKLDVMVTRKEADSDLAEIPFFVDSQGQIVWIVYNPSDPVFAAAERAFLTNMIVSGKYADLYQNSFGQLPSYEGVKSLLGL